jgi:hypothetical protein
VPEGSGDVVVIANGAQSMKRERAFQPGMLPTQLSITIKQWFVEPGTVGVPERRPDVFSVKPAGSSVPVQPPSPADRLILKL